MQDEKRIVSPLLYYLLIAGLTNLVFMVFGLTVFLLLSPSVKFDPILVGVILFVLIQKSLIVGFVMHSFHKQGRFDKVWGTKVVGFYFGRLYGLFIGGFVGSQIGKGIGAIIGAIAFYFIGRWVGFRVGFAIGRLLDRNLMITNASEGYNLEQRDKD
jgi:hypothetical protein